MIKRGFAVGKVRKIMQSIGFLGPAVALSILPVVDKPWQAVLCMCMSQVRQYRLSRPLACSR